MKLTQSDYNERKARIDAGAATDEDRRLVEHYEREGFTADGDGKTAHDGQTSPQQAESNDQPVGITGRAEAEVVKGEPAKKTTVAKKPTRQNGTN